MNIISAHLAFSSAVAVTNMNSNLSGESVRMSKNFQTIRFFGFYFFTNSLFLDLKRQTSTNFDNMFLTLFLFFKKSTA